MHGYLAAKPSSFDSLSLARIDTHAAQRTKMKFYFPVASRYGKGAGGVLAPRGRGETDGFSLGKF